MQNHHDESESKKPCDVCGSSSCPAILGWSFRCPEAPIEVLESRFHDFDKAFQKLVNKASKLGVPAPSFVKGGPFTRIQFRTDPDGFITSPRRYRGAGTVIPVVVSGVTPKFNDWSLLAVLEPVDLPDGTSANVVSSVPGAGEVPAQYRTSGPYCDHCRTTRRRKETYLVCHEDGRVAQVGSDCVADFLGGVSPQQLAGLFSFLRDDGRGGEEDEGGGWGSRDPSTLDLVEYLGLVVREVRAEGWLSRKAAREKGIEVSSADRAWGRAFPLSGRKKQIADEEEIALARSAVAWALTLEGGSDYEHNVGLRAKLGVVDGKSAGIAASIWPSFERAREREVERRKRLASILGSRFQGAEGDKIERFLTVTNIYDIDGQFGVTHLHLFQDADGHAYKWFASSERLDVGSLYRVAGTVKKHERRAIKSRDGSEGPEIETTVLTRCGATDPYVGVVKVTAASRKLVGGDDAVKALGLAAIEGAPDLLQGPLAALVALRDALLATGKPAGVKAADKVGAVVASTLAKPAGSEAE